MGGLVHFFGDLAEGLRSDSFGKSSQMRAKQVGGQVAGALFERGVSLCKCTVRRGQISPLLVDPGHQCDSTPVARKISFRNSSLGDLDAAVQSPLSLAFLGQKTDLTEQGSHVHRIQVMFDRLVACDLQVALGLLPAGLIVALDQRTGERDPHLELVLEPADPLGDRDGIPQWRTRARGIAEGHRDQAARLSRCERDLHEIVAVAGGPRDEHAVSLVGIRELLLLERELGPAEREPDGRASPRERRGLVAHPLARRDQAGLRALEVLAADRGARQERAGFDQAIRIGLEPIAGARGELLDGFEVAVGELDVGESQEDAALQGRCIELIEERRGLLERRAHHGLTMSEQRFVFGELDERDGEGLTTGRASLADACPHGCERHSSSLPRTCDASPTMASASAVQLIRIARLQRFVGVFARGGDREATADALAALSSAARAGGLPGDALRRARQAAELLVDGDLEAAVRSLLHLGAACLDTGDAETAASASELAEVRAAALPEPVRSELIGCAALLGGVAHALDGDDERARACLDEARDRMVAIDRPEGAALALTQYALLDVAADRREHAEVCFLFARDFHRASDQAAAAAAVAAVAARAYAAAGWPNADRWFREAIAEADYAGSALLGAELVVERAVELERAGSRTDAATLAADGATRCARLPEAPRELVAHARLVLARTTADPGDALHHLEAAFELALDLRDPAALAGAMEVVVTGLVAARFTDVGWRLVDRFRERLGHAGFAGLAETAEAALAELRA